jgi:sugar O-acyltransferase (sialic acid O-acetyltransferase NeuD family)
MRELLLLAASGLAREAAEADQTDYRVIGILDDNPDLHGDRLAGVEILGGIHLASEHDAALLACIGAGSGRRAVVERLAALGITDDRYATLIDRSARVPQSCTVGAGTIILAGTVLTTDVSIGRHVVLMPNVTLTHDDILGDFATVTSGVCLGGSVVLGEECYLGMNASVRQGTRVGAGATVGMGAAVLGDVPPGETWVGVPAKQRTREHSA